MNKANNKREFCTIILAAGKGTRMKSDLAKVLHLLCGRPLLSYVVDMAKKAGSSKTIVIVGHQGERVKEEFRGEGLIFIEQRDLLGTGHAVLQAKDEFASYQGTIVILCGDVPLLRPSTVQGLYDRHRKAQSVVTVLTTSLDDPTGYGRIVKGPQGAVLRIVEERDASVEERKIGEINTGIYCVESAFLFHALSKITNDNAQKEYYLTDIIAIATAEGSTVDTLIAQDAREVMGINRDDELEKARQYLEQMKDVRM